MRVVHIYPQSDDMVAQYVGMVQRVMGVYDGDRPDVVHCHGCWNREVASRAQSYGVRMVLSPHGQLQPWVTEQEPMARTRTWQRRLAERCYVLVAHGVMEADTLKSMGWNPRIETVRNPIVTATISEEEACRQLGVIYQKVMDSDVRQLMSAETLDMLSCLLKAGITGDRRWLRDAGTADTLLNNSEKADWRQIQIYAHQEHVAEIVKRGIEVTGVDVPATDATSIDSYLPADYDAHPQTLTDAVAIVGALHQRPTIRLLCDLHKALHRDDVNDARLADVLRQKRLMKFGRRLMAVMAELTQLDEGFMPFEPLNDKQTNEIKTAIAENLKI